MDRDEFYIGYLERAPHGVARRVRLAVALALATGAVVALATALLQGPFAAKTFEFGSEREFVGWVRLTPFPRLVVAAPGDAPEGAALVAYPLSHAGSKRGAVDLLTDHDGAFVSLRGWLIYRGGNTMVDLVPGSIRAVDAAASAPPRGDDGGSGVAELGEHTLVGQIVDSKCYFGVMNPATGKVHRACAARCISSGTPPVLAVRDRAGRERHLLLVGRDGRSLGREILEFVAEPVEITGRVSRLDQLTVLWAEPADIRRLGSS